MSGNYLFMLNTHQAGGDLIPTMSHANCHKSHAEEVVLGRILRARTGTDAFIVTNYPAHIRPCQVHPLAAAEGTTAHGTNSFDFMGRGQEICMGFQQIHDAATLRAAMIARHGAAMDPDSPMWRPYVGAFEAGVHPHGCFAFGMNRVLQAFLGLGDVHETVLFPRDVGRVAP